MTEAHPDIRVIRSVALMEQALLRILKEEGIKGLTVKHLCKIAGINRGTFYLHYRDIFHLIEETAFFSRVAERFRTFRL
ncbi:TetR family transcriptional regulator [Cohnella rhizosphaerae]|uniref:TetR/AcrR family transcriptional regulator n=1 Tax=Cohnella rhizosphaerae TaxID=1457232 RepID=A0A9X4KZS8_9BACL|nr:TetR family transcriptional regulator [Cohnella rhizosphaerae]MDG0813481.1 TetR/AcrR family transcriptional regulator [Cohnella rhizosphaerae]